MLHIKKLEVKTIFDFVVKLTRTNKAFLWTALPEQQQDKGLQVF